VHAHTCIGLERCLIRLIQIHQHQWYTEHYFATSHNINIVDDNPLHTQWQEKSDIYWIRSLELVSLSRARSNVRSFNEALSHARPLPISVLMLCSIAYRWTSCTFNDSLTKLQNAAQFRQTTQSRHRHLSRLAFVKLPYIPDSPRSDQVDQWILFREINHLKQLLYLRLAHVKCLIAKHCCGLHMHIDVCSAKILIMDELFICYTFTLHYLIALYHFNHRWLLSINTLPTYPFQTNLSFPRFHLASVSSKASNKKHGSFSYKQDSRHASENHWLQL